MQDVLRIRLHPHSSLYEIVEFCNKNISIAKKYNEYNEIENFAENELNF